MHMAHRNHEHKVKLVDDGTLDTVLKIDGQHIRFDQDEAVEYRRRDGSFKTMGILLMVAQACDGGLLDDTPPEPCYRDEDCISHSMQMEG